MVVNHFGYIKRTFKGLYHLFKVFVVFFVVMSERYRVCEVNVVWWGVLFCLQGSLHEESSYSASRRFSGSSARGVRPDLYLSLWPRHDLIPNATLGLLSVLHGSVFRPQAWLGVVCVFVYVLKFLWGKFGSCFSLVMRVGLVVYVLYVKHG